MSILEELHRSMNDVGKEGAYCGYWYKMSDILTILMCGMLCGLQDIDDVHEWSISEPTKQFLLKQFKIRKVPCRAQFYNIIGIVDSEKFGHAFISWMRYVLQNDVEGKTVAIDGKTICSTDKLSKDGNPLHIASAIVSDLGLVIGSRECGTKTGEITAFRELLDMLNVKGSVVVADALHCTKKSAEKVIEKKGDYLFVVKDNQETLREEIEYYFQQEENLEKHSTTEKNGGRIEKRTAYVERNIDWLTGHEHWLKLSSIGAIHREFYKDGKKSSEWHYYISSASLSAENLLKYARLEWGVEAMHWLLDVHFAEDKTRVWDMNVQKMLNTMRKVVLNLVRLYKTEACTKTPLSKVLKRNLFDLGNLSAFLQFFTND